MNCKGHIERTEQLLRMAEQDMLTPAANERTDRRILLAGHHIRIAELLHKIELDTQDKRPTEF